MVKCGFCNSTMAWGEGLCEDGIWYHDSCYIRKLKKRIGILEQKIKSGKITLDESNEGKELTKLLFNLTEKTDTPTIPNDKLINRNKVFVFETKPMPAVFAVPSCPIIPYEEQKRIEGQTDKSLMKCKSKKQASRKRKPQGCVIINERNKVKVK